MSSLIEDDTRYVKLVLLLVKGGTYVSKKHTQNILDADNTTIDICLKTHRDEIFNAFKRRVINPKLWELLCSDSGKPKDVELWDISAHAYVLLNLFDKRLQAVEKDAIIKLRDKRNELLHSVVSTLPEKDFLGEWSQLTKVVYQLSTGLSSNDQDYVDKLIEDISAIQHIDKATFELKAFENQDDFVKDVLAEQLCIHERRLEELTQRTCELEKRNKEKDQSGFDELFQRTCSLEEIKRNIESGQIEIIARITVSSSTQTACDAAHHKLLEAAKRCLTGGNVNQEEDEVFTACNNMFNDMSKDGASIKKVEEGSVWITISCSTLTSLKSAFLYLTKTVYIRRLQELGKALSQSVGCCVKLNVNISLESLISTLDKNDKTLVLRCLLTDVGTVVLRKVFDHIVGPDLNVYLDTYPDRKPIFLELLPSTTAQLLLQPRNDNTPSSDRLYITDLTKLLRHVCGLRPPNDQVWEYPEATDNRIEAYITRLRRFRKEIILKEGIDFENETHLTAKCIELSKTLEGLSSYCGFNVLQEEINEVILRIIDQKQQAEENIEKEEEREKDELNLETGDLK